MTTEKHVFGTDLLTATVTAHGAELISLRDPTGRELMWNGGPPWPRHSPVLFPIVGRLPAHEITLNDQPLHLPQHGFARDCTFHWLDRTAQGCTLELTENAATLTGFPERFRLRMTYRVEENRLTVSYELHNPDSSAVLHASLGAHPAFIWPLREDVPKTAHQLIFSENEPAPIRRIDDKGVLPEAFPTPVQGKNLPLTEELFVADAIIMPELNSHSVSYITPKKDGLHITWNGFRDLGLWMKPGADFLCIEPWHGYAAPGDFSGDFSRKPGLLHLEAGESWNANWSVETI